MSNPNTRLIRAEAASNEDNAQHEGIGNKIIRNLKKILNLVFMSPIGCGIVLSIFLAIPAASITIGTIYLHECPAEHYIPVFLIVFGVFIGVRNLIGLCRRCRNTNDHGSCDLVYFLDLFILIWMITGSVWTYRITYPNYDDVKSENYCDRTLYLYSFYLLTTIYGLTATVLFCSCCMYCCYSAINAMEMVDDWVEV